MVHVSVKAILQTFDFINKVVYIIIVIRELFD